MNTKAVTAQSCSLFEIDAEQAILNFVKTTTDKSNPKFVPPEERIATFDQDGTTWVEQPIYSQVLFVFDRIAELSPQHPERKNRQPFKAVVSDDKAAMEKPNTNPTTAPNRRGIRAVRTQKM
jgi:hypothetical protein